MLLYIALAKAWHRDLYMYDVPKGGLLYSSTRCSLPNDYIILQLNILAYYVWEHGWLLLRAAHWLSVGTRRHTSKRLL